MRPTLLLSWSRQACLLTLLLFAVGCAKEEVQQREVKYDKQRLLGAMVLTDENAWFFKLVGRDADTQANRDDFYKMVRSIKFNSDVKNPIEFDLPEGWMREAGTGMRFANLYIPRGQVVSVTRLGSDGGGLVANLNRWREQLRLKPLDGSELIKQFQEVPLADRKLALVVEMEAARTLPSQDAEPPAPEPETPRSKDLDYQKPEGWTDAPAGRMSVATFRAVDGGKTAEVTIIPLGGAAGGVTANVNRWRGQVGLADATEDEIKKESKSIDVESKPCVYVDLIGGPDGDQRMRMLAVIVPKGERTWFVKMLGPDAVVGKNKTAFEAFVRSLKIGGGK